MRGVRRGRPCPFRDGQSRCGRRRFRVLSVAEPTHRTHYGGDVLPARHLAQYQELEDTYRNEPNFRTLTVAGRPAFVQDDRNLSGTQACQLWVPLLKPVSASRFYPCGLSLEPSRCGTNSLATTQTRDVEDRTFCVVGVDPGKRILRRYDSTTATTSPALLGNRCLRLRFNSRGYVACSVGLSLFCDRGSRCHWAPRETVPDFRITGARHGSKS